MKRNNEDNGYYLHDWKTTKKGGVVFDFGVDVSTLDGATILLASYTYDYYMGDAFVLFRKDGKYYEVTGGHCSCCGLEGQWKPEETDLHTLLHQATTGRLGVDYDDRDMFNKELLLVLHRELSS